MKILVLSDLHLEFGAPWVQSTGTEYDAVVLAGDIHNPGLAAVEWAKADGRFGRKPVFLVPGNHEFYRCEINAELGEMRQASAGSNVHLLDRDVVVLNEVRFIGCTLWTDFRLGVRQPDGSTTSSVQRAMKAAAAGMNDFRLIQVLAWPHGQRSARALRAEDAVAMHERDRDWLAQKLAEPFPGPTVVVTHHAPSSGSVAPEYAADWLTPTFASELPDGLFDVPALWVHGHTHTSFDYERGNCRIVSNPRGYPMRNGSFENRLYDPGFIVEVVSAPGNVLPENVEEL
ncbi:MULTISPECIES: metallophosphoesterase [unclassified Roseateles]|uniref:metallophosphoesterase n=1 Tax=unclassified Roseateles TaxID=2626991 RepID=UPI0006FEBBE3|nr:MULTISPECIES: metallophosphoesterase [unclassified Roseateles]KQW52313.1 hypothetical protein ASC81_00880 [Pelomonas sp. Root405]KRA78547.1 hypothetical protein ASD88_00880 [Pelomonas sp. Root662]